MKSSQILELLLFKNNKMWINCELLSILQDCSKNWWIRADFEWIIFDWRRFNIFLVAFLNARSKDVFEEVLYLETISIKCCKLTRSRKVQTLMHTKVARFYHCRSFCPKYWPIESWSNPDQIFPQLDQLAAARFWKHRKNVSDERGCKESRCRLARRIRLLRRRSWIRAFEGECFPGDRLRSSSCSIRSIGAFP